MMEAAEERKARWGREENTPATLPWRLETFDNSMGESGIRILGSKDDTVADNEPYYPQALSAGNAVLIVRAVNAHDALVAALEEAKEYVLHFESERIAGADLSTRIDAALALARGEG